MTEATDSELLERIGGGDRAAFDGFVRRHQASVFRYLRSMADADADAEDALQEAFLAVWRSAHTYEGRGSARAWVLTVARNALYRQGRLRAGEPSSFESLEALGLAAGWGDEADSDPLARLADADLLERAMERLDAGEREVLILRELEGFSGAETASLLHLSLSAMKSRLHRARLALTGALKELTDVEA